MYIEVSDQNDKIRDFIIKNLYADFYNKQDCEDTLETLRELKENNLWLYKILIGIMCCDFCDMNIFYDDLYENSDETEIQNEKDEEEFYIEETVEVDEFFDEEAVWENDFELEEHFKKLKVSAKELLNLNNINEVIKYIEKDNTILIDFIESSRDILCLFNDEKKDIYSREMSHYKNLSGIYPLHFLDILEYTKQLTKEDLIILQRNYYKTIDTIDYEETTEQEFYESSINFVADTLIDEFNQDCYNYKMILLDIIPDYYEYAKFLLCNNIKGKEEIDRKLLKFVETNSLYEIVNETIKNKSSLCEIIKYFIEYNYKTSKQKESIIKNIRSKNVRDIRAKILLNKRKKDLS